MFRETFDDKKRRARKILRILKKTYTEPGEFVHWTTPLELVVGTLLSAQCTDKRVNIVTKSLFKKYRTPKAYASASLDELEAAISSVTYFRSKARYIQGLGRMILRDFGGTVPSTLEDLVKLPGIGYKSAHLVMSKVHAQHTGIAVDTHVKRVAPRLGLTRQKDPGKIGADLEALYPRADFLSVNEYLIMHGRAICAPRNPKCNECPVRSLCPYGRVSRA
ncbi:MAG: endonuclease III [Candidatus Kerfeldbacteria bacterium]|nr:endonuclease III [Candidatus Kerfeldbacteria bacterium]